MDFAIKPLRSIDAVVGLIQPVIKGPGVQGNGFKDALLQALQETSALQQESGRLSKEFSLDNPTISLEETMLAGVKSTISFQATLQARNRIIQAYSEIMNMQI